MQMRRWEKLREEIASAICTEVAIVVIEQKSKFSACNYQAEILLAQFEATDPATLPFVIDKVASLEGWWW